MINKLRNILIVKFVELIKMIRKLILASTLKHQLLSSNNKKLNVERAGILIGNSNQDTVQLTHSLENKEPIRRGKYFITRSFNDIWDKLNIHVKNNPEDDYIGEWHTHPSSISKMSYTDKKAMSRILKSKEYGNVDFRILAIVSHNEIKFWKFYFTKTKIRRIKHQLLEVEEINQV